MDATTELIRQRSDIVDIVGQYVVLRPAGNDRFKACCPFHDEKTPSFYVSRDKGFYKCFGCGEAGDIYKFLQKVENLTFPEAKRQLADRYGIELPKFRGRNVEGALGEEEYSAPSEREKLRQVSAAATAFFREQFGGNAGMAARDYTRERGLSRETWEKFGIGYSLDAWDALQKQLTGRLGFSNEECASAGLLIARENENEGATRFYDRFRHRLMFPIWDASGRVIAFGGRALEGGQTGTPDAKYINSPESLLFKKREVLYAYHLARPEVPKRESVIVTEGYMDAIALHEAGFANTVATLGTALTTQHVALLRRLSPKIVYLCFDGDSAGMRAALRTAPLFSANNLDVRVVALPAKDDPDTFIRKNGAEAFAKALVDAKLLMQYRVEMTLSEFDLTELADRKQGIRAASEAIAEVTNGTERDSYIVWLSQQWARAEGITSTGRMELVESAVRREVLSAQKRFSKREQFRENYAEQQLEPSEEINPVGDLLVEGVGGEVEPGVIKAERALLAVLLCSPSWRGHVLTKMPPELWTQSAHREIVSLLQSEHGENDEPVNPVDLIEKLPETSSGLIAELMLGDDAQTPAGDKVIDDWIARVQGHWAKKRAAEILAKIKDKLERGEEITVEERSVFAQAWMTGELPQATA